MTLAQVQAAVALVVSLIGTWAGLVIAVALLLPLQTARAEEALSASAKRSFWAGVAMLIPLALSFLLIVLPNPTTKLLGFLLALAIGAVLTIGAAGMAQLMGKRIGEMSGAKTSFGALVRGSLVYSLGLFFPLIGWYLFAPLSSICALGAGIQALWPARRTALPPIHPNAPLGAHEAA